ncbi:MAG: CHRD domain-containing protein, partial [Chitinophagaceae bacterium]
MTNFNATLMGKPFSPSKLKIFLSSVLGILIAFSASATVFSVNILTDSHAASPGAGTGLDAAGKVSFRSALEAANAVGGAHTINVPVGTYNLTLGMITQNDIVQNITITGAGAATTIINMVANAAQDRILLVGTSGAFDGMVTSISGLTFQGGLETSDIYGGGAILAGGGPNCSLNLTNCIFKNNAISPTAVNTGGTNSGGAVEFNGGGSLIINNCQFINNTVPKGEGGAVRYFLENLVSAGNGVCTITNSTFTGNSTTGTGVGDGGALAISAQGRLVGGVTLAVTVNNNTFTGNSSTGITNGGGAIYLTNSFDVGNTWQVHYNRITGNSTTAADGSSGLGQSGGSQGNVDATNNWWGCNTGPGVAGTCDRAVKGPGGVGTQDISKWLQLKTTASPGTICNTAASSPTNTSTITTSFLTNSANEAITVANLSTLIGRTVNWGPTTLGSLSGQQLTIQASGTATALFTSNGTGGTATINTQVDNVPTSETTPSRASITVNTASVAPTGVTGATTICSGLSTTLTVAGGSKGTAAVTQWYTGSCGGTLVFTGDAYPTPALANNATYFVRYSGTCNTTTCATINVFVNDVTGGSVGSDQTVCSAGDPVTFTETSASTGSGTLSYQWQSNTTGCGASFSNIGGATSSTYDPPSGLSVTTYYRRVTTSTLNAVLCVANSNCITVTVNNVTGGIVGADQIICSGADPAPFTQTVASTGSGSLSYQWQSSTTSCVAGFSDIGGATGLTYDVPAGLLVTTFYHRVTTSTLTGIPCSVNSNCISVTVNNVTGGTVGTDQAVCSGGDPVAFTQTQASTGTGALSYQWQSSTTSCAAGFSDIGGATGITYDPPAGLLVATYYHRITRSTLGGVPCAAISNCITVSITPDNTITLTSGPGSDVQTVCINTPINNITYSTTGATGANFTGLPTGVTGVWAANVVTISGTPNVSGVFTYTVTLTGGCGNVSAPTPASVGRRITVNANNTISLTSAAGSNAQTVCINTPIVNITYSTTGATGASFGGLPAGVTGVWASNVVTISGTPSASGTFNYTVTLTGGCGNITANGTITVTPNNTITLTSAAGTNNQTVAVNTAITTITYSTTGATGANIAGLPAGVTGNWASNVVMISGTPTASGNFNYTVTLTGGCGSITANGSINVTNCGATLTSAAGTNAQNVCINSAIVNITYSTISATGANFNGLPAGVTGNWASNVITISGTPTASGIFNYTVTLTGGACSGQTVTGTITVNALPVVSITGSSSICAACSPGPGTTIYTAVLNGPAESPSNASPGTGTATITINTVTNTMRVQCSFSGLTGTTTASHVHSATAVANTGTAGVATTTPTFTGFPLGVTSGTYDNTFDMTLPGSYNPAYVTANGGTTASAFAALQAGLAANKAYYNIHTSTFGGGEIRGFLSTFCSSANSSTTLSPTSGGTWISNNPGIATVTNAGVVNGVSAGSATFTFTNSTTNCTATTSAVTVNPSNTVTAASSAPTLCINTPLTTITHTTTGATGIGTPVGLPAGVTAAWASNTITISGTPTVSGVFNYTIPLTGGCGGIAATGTITVTANSTITLTSAGGTNAQTVCINTAITNITYGTTGATGASFSGLPAGVTGNWAANVVTISGTPTAAGIFNYMVTLTGGCGATSAIGTITVISNNTINLTSAAGTDNQNVGVNTPITTITYSTTGATGANISGLPAGVTGNWASNVVTISGTPTVSGNFNYTVTLTGGCGSITAMGTITVLNCGATLTSAPGTNAQVVCVNSAISDITYSTFNATGANFAGLPAGVTGIWASNVITISGTPTASGTFNYTVTLTGGACNGQTVAGTITVNALPVVSITGSNSICAACSPGPGTTIYKATLNGPAESPSNASPGTGTATITINTVTNTMRVQCSFSGLTGTTTASHVHSATAVANIGTAGVATTTPTFTGFPLGVTSGTYDVTFDMTLATSYNPSYVTANGGTPASAFAALQAGLAANKAYYNIHTTTFGGGEIRGFLSTFCSSANASTTLSPTSGGTWISNNPGIATVTNAGVVNGVSSGSATFTFTNSTTNCSATTSAVTVNPSNTVTAASSTPTLCINTPLGSITHTTTGATGIGTALGLPAGVTASWSSNTITISGTPTVSGVFNYTIPLAGGCGGIAATGTITVTANNTITLTSAAGSNAQSKCINTAITNITYSTTGATGASFAGLPAGVAGNWAANVVTISGTPTAIGTYNYMVTLTGGCGNITANGSISVTPNNAITSATAAMDPICTNVTTTLTANGVNGTNAVVTWWTGPGGTGTNLGTGTTIEVPVGTYYARVTGDCGAPVEAMVIVHGFPPPTCESVTNRLYVDANNCTAGNGSSWTCALNQLRDAINIANGNSSIKEIWVADGIYKPTAGNDRTAVMATTRADLQILGGFAGGEANATDANPVLNPTIISGDIGVPGDMSDNSYRLFNIGGSPVSSSALVIDGFIFEKGNADAPGDGDHSVGAALLSYGIPAATPVQIKRCIFRNNF